MANYALVNNTSVDIRDFEKEILSAGQLPEELADMFVLEILQGHNEDGSNRLVLNWGGDPGDDLSREETEDGDPGDSLSRVERS